MPADVFSIPLFASDVLKYLDTHHIRSVNIFGYSMGGYAAMYVAKHFPGRTKKLITLATKFHWDKKVAEKESRILDANSLAEKLPAFAKHSNFGINQMTGNRCLIKQKKCCWPLAGIIACN